MNYYSVCAFNKERDDYECLGVFLNEVEADKFEANLPPSDPRGDGKSIVLRHLSIGQLIDHLLLFEHLAAEKSATAAP
jgi:hypothetical protein